MASAVIRRPSPAKVGAPVQSGSRAYGAAEQSVTGGGRDALGADESGAGLLEFAGRGAQYGRVLADEDGAGGADDGVVGELVEGEPEEDAEIGGIAQPVADLGAMLRTSTWPARSSVMRAQGELLERGAGDEGLGAVGGPLDVDRTRQEPDRVRGGSVLVTGEPFRDAYRRVEVGCVPAPYETGQGAVGGGQSLQGALAERPYATPTPGTRPESQPDAPLRRSDSP